jgi:hypothetical protein
VGGNAPSEGGNSRAIGTGQDESDKKGMEIMKSVANECATLFAGISLLAPGLGLVLKHNPQWGIPVWWFLPYGYRS